MNTPTPYRPDHTRAHLDHPGGDWPALLGPSSGYVPVIVDAALSRWLQQYDQALDLPHTTAVEHAIRADRLAVLHDRRARWWDVLAAWTYHRSGWSVAFVYAHAAQTCASRDRDSARFWRDTAADWRARAEHRPTSDAAGALSNWHELGVTA